MTCKSIVAVNNMHWRFTKSTSWEKVGRTRSKKYWHLLLCQTSLWEMLSPNENSHERAERFSEGSKVSQEESTAIQSVLRNIQLVLLDLQQRYISILWISMNFLLLANLLISFWKKSKVPSTSFDCLNVRVATSWILFCRWQCFLRRIWCFWSFLI